MAGNRDDLSCHEEDVDGLNGNDIELEKLSLGPDGSKKLLVLDLAGVLCDRVFHKNRANIPDNRTPDAASGSFFGKFSGYTTFATKVFTYSCLTIVSLSLQEAIL